MIEILRYTPANKNKIIGYVDIELKKMNLIIRRIVHIQSGEKRWFTLPAFFDENAAGNNKYMRYFQFKQEVHNGELLAMIPALVEQFCKDNQIEPVQSLEATPYFDDSQCPF